MVPLLLEPMPAERRVAEDAASVSSIMPCSECTIPVLSRRREGEAFNRLKVFNFPDGQLDIQVVVAQKGNVQGERDVPVRIHSECFTGDVLRSAKCDCGLQLSRFFSLLDVEDRGVLLYVRGHEGRGIGLEKKLDAYRLQESDEKLDTLDANVRLGLPVDMRDYAECAQVLQSLGVSAAGCTPTTRRSSTLSRR